MGSNEKYGYSFWLTVVAFVLALVAGIMFFAAKK
jgi:hypothetical protein